MQMFIGFYARAGSIWKRSRGFELCNKGGLCLASEKQRQERLSGGGRGHQYTYIYVYTNFHIQDMHT